jgi:cyclopropane fatty-acyl-phospholipid synthase-like methyltransferase
MLSREMILSDESPIDPNLKLRLKMYVLEAEFFEDVLASDVSKLSSGSHLVEIGAGIGLLALNLADRGFEVTAFEPEASGFTEMHNMREVVLSNWVGKIPDVKFVDRYIDAETELDKPADYMFAINVIEHVPEYEQLIVDALRLKSDSATMRLICPNYAIPYEPHLEIPIIFTKNITWRIFKKRIAKSTIPNPIDFWRDLSWPTQRKLKQKLNYLGLVTEFSRDATNHYIKRALTDPKFIERKGPVIGNCLKAFAIVAQNLTRFMPMSMIPIIDCRITGKTR